MVLTAEQKSLFLFDELMSSYGVDLENVESESKVMSSCPAMKQAQFDGNVQSQQRHAASREPAALTGQNDERLRNENKEAITAAAKGLQNAGDILQSKHGEKLQVLNSELEDLFVNSPDIEYAAFATFLKKLLEQESSSEASALALVACSTKALAKRLGTKFVWHYMRPFAAKELAPEAERYFDPAANGNHV